MTAEQIIKILSAFPKAKVSVWDDKDIKVSIYISDNGDVNIIFNNVRICDDIYGYVYVFQFDDNYKHCSNSVQYKSYQEIHPIDILEIKFSNFKQFYTINSEDIKCEKTSKSY